MSAERTRLMRCHGRWSVATTVTCAVVFVLALGLTVSTSAQSGSQATSAYPGAAEVDFFRNNIEPIFMRDRGGTLPGYAACVMCHTWQTSLRFRLETPETDAGWTREQSRQNFQMLTRLVNTANTESSPLLVKPLAPAGGGAGHTGGAYWESRQDPEYQTVAKWIRSLPADRYVPPPLPPVDFEFFRACVQQVFQTAREGHVNCSNCHDAGTGERGFAPVPGGGRTVWNDTEARRAFAVMSRLIVPGNPVESRFLLKPLHPDGGGSYAHNGPRRWQSRDDAEWQMLAAWIRGEKKGNSCS